MWLISDTHFGHHNIIKYEDRPQNHDLLMLCNLAKLVGPDDTLIHLGDVCFARYDRIAREFPNLLPGGKKILLEGNHDIKKHNKVRKANWDKVFSYREVWQFEQENITFALTHRPENLNGVNAHIKIHGHVHSARPKFYRRDGALWVNACVEVWDYSPFHISEVIKEYHDN